MISQNHLRHLSQFSTNIFPCNSAKWRRFTPDLICNPSIFWLTMYLICPESSNVFKAIWHLVGIASEKETFTCGDLPSFWSVQTPFGPLNITKKKQANQLSLNINTFPEYRNYFTENLECQPKCLYQLPCEQQHVSMPKSFQPIVHIFHRQFFHRQTSNSWIK